MEEISVNESSTDPEEDLGKLLAENTTRTSRMVISFRRGNSARLNNQWRGTAGVSIFFRFNTIQDGVAIVRHF